METDVLHRDAQELWDTLGDEFGDRLRVVARYHKNGVEAIIRDDVRSQYTKTEGREIVDQVILNQLNSRTLNQSFKNGELQSFIEVFENAWIVVYPDDINVKRGFIVSIDRNDHSSITHVEAAIQHLDARSSIDFE